MEISRIAAQAHLYSQSQTAQIARVGENGLNEKQTEIKAQSALIKSDNDLFGALKTLEKAIASIKESVNLGNEAAAEKIAAANYKGENLFRNFPLSDGGTIDVSEKLTFENGKEEFIKALDLVSKEAQESLNAVKKRILSSTAKLGESARESYKQSGEKGINPANIFSTTNADYLKEQFGKLMR
ncbi:MAG: hypothetical protein LBE89_01320 [Helicobacteraceae bacterium]|jgi:curli biogenesis system outer membrane secretion channel CsgG|nr:hypothetical protein [Helicobacteraceae bacterium]